jgi:AraC-like DNA-binding protein
MPNSAPKAFFRYLPVSPRDKAWGMHVTTAGYNRITPDMEYPPPGHPERYTFAWKSGRVLDEYQLHYFPRGGGFFESQGGGQRKIEAGDFFLLFPGTWHRYTPCPETGWDEFWTGFQGDDADRLVKQGFFSPANPVFKPRAEHGALNLFSEIFIQLHTEPSGFMQVIAAHTMQLLASVLASDQARGAGSPAEEIIRKAKLRLRGELNHDIDLDGLAMELGVSYAWLRKMFRQYTGMSPHQYHLQLRLSKARQLLAVSGCSVKEAAAQIGYSDEYYFSRLFKLKTGVPPEAWKRLGSGDETDS